jgi:hypothetical protein
MGPLGGEARIIGTDVGEGLQPRLEPCDRGEQRVDRVGLPSR